MNFDLAYMLEIIPELLVYIPITLYLAIVSMIIAVAIGVVLSLLLVNKTPVLLQLSKLYISFFRGTPVLVQLLMIYFGLPQLFPWLNSLSAVNAAIIAFSLNTSAYLAEIFRAALISVDKGQTEAAISTGLTYRQAVWGIVLPQAVRNAVPATGNMFIGLIKNSSLAFTIGVTELLAQGKLLATATLQFFEAYLAVGIIYWGMTIIYSWVQRWYEARINRPYEV
ncbi:MULTISPECIES: amino acid ABC transporter permease [Salinicoccus]|jgi:putative amino-acid transport system permease protein|uniref:ABC transporter permease n=1 Tax=Salinicoccus roseus TaxID=45670 RepID=A0A0C2DMQ5_9STAP|nr:MULTISPECIES: amino acid ABC transporter permease [Salinicoccus]KIH71298.1 ABC transporter permease [Salinicoccus roseus]MCC4723645.1 amino acid ABC transporter permease [Salinicoccus sp. RF5]MDB0580038.1 amino acid ABC transporter permease [Salinicoccus roseus]RPE51051.1 amino acid ABC transporter membrane protein (PAAT family) [Salinicoccus roseus]GGA78398.1 putative amino-acid permease protein YxeN [Salinicoccus roseus]